MAADPFVEKDTASNFIATSDYIAKDTYYMYDPKDKKLNDRDNRTDIMFIRGDPSKWNNGTTLLHGVLASCEAPEQTLYIANRTGGYGGGVSISKVAMDAELVVFNRNTSQPHLHEDDAIKMIAAKEQKELIVATHNPNTKQSRIYFLDADELTPAQAPRQAGLSIIEPVAPFKALHHYGEGEGFIMLYLDTGVNTTKFLALDTDQQAYEAVDFGKDWEKAFNVSKIEYND